MKTVEEMRVAVLAECEAVCPDKLHAPIECGHLAFGYVEDDGIRMEAWFLYVGEATAPMSLYALAGEQVWLAAYRLLGLSERDAVEAERAEMMKTVDALSAMVSVDPVSFAELEAKNAALVAAINEAIHHGGYFYANGHGEHHGNGGEKVLNVVGKILTAAIEANEKGGKGE